MKYSVITLSLLTALTACGGGGGGGSGSNSGGNTPATNGITDTGSALYSASLKTFAEVWTGADLVGVLTDMAVIAGVTGNCTGGGTASFSGTTQTVNKCLRKYPSGEAYSGTYTVSGTPSAGTLSNFSIQALDPSTSAVQYSLTTGSVSSSTVIGSTGIETTNITNGAASFTIGSSTYGLSNVNTHTTNDGSSLLFDMNGVTPITFSVAKGATKYDVYLNQAVKSIGNARPSAGKATVSYATTTACSPFVVNFISATQFTLACASDTAGAVLTKNWTDADVLAALQAAQK